jgi:hypothetical protein
MPTLADIYSALNTFKRKSSDFVQNPGTSLEQMLFAANENAREFNKKHALATDYTIAQARGQQPTPEQTQAEMGVRNTLAEAYNPVGMTVIPFGKGRNVTVPIGQDVAAVNPVEIRARQAIDDLVNHAKYFGVDSPIDHTKMSIGGVMQHLDDYFGRSQQVAALPEEAKASLRNLMYKAENAANAHKRVYGENKFMGLPEEAANKETFNKRAEWIPQELEDAYQNKQITKRQYERQVMKNFKEFFNK